MNTTRCSAWPTLPPRWWEGLTREQARRVIAVESIPPGELTAKLGTPTRHEDGYVKLHLGRFHPYANTSGQQYLHRYLMMRAERRALETSEHVHHRNGDKGAADLAELELMWASNHGHYHWYYHGAGAGKQRACECVPVPREGESVPAPGIVVASAGQPF